MRCIGMTQEVDMEQHPLAPPRIRISYPQLAAYSRL
jgi:hypothetical protein